MTQTSPPIQNPDSDDRALPLNERVERATREALDILRSHGASPGSTFLNSTAEVYRRDGACAAEVFARTKIGGDANPDPAAAAVFEVIKALERHRLPISLATFLLRKLDKIQEQESVLFPPTHEERKP